MSRAMKQHNQDRRNMMMTFGKHKGRFIKDIPDDYVMWAINNIKDMALLTFFREEWDYRIDKKYLNPDIKKKK
jgi:hypothetical protein